MIWHMRLARQFPVRGCVGPSGARLCPAGRAGGLGAVAWLWALVFLAGVAGSNHGFGQAQDAPVPPHKFLLVIETSRTMKPRVSGMAAVAKNLLDSKFHGQMRSNDLVGVWTYDQELRTNAVPYEELSPGTAVSVLNTIIGGSYEKRADPTVVWRSLARALFLTPRLTLVLISSGEGELTGTVYDQEVNGAWNRWRESQQKARQAVMTVLRSRAGKLTHWSVTPGPWPLELPALPPESRISAARETVPLPAVTNVASTPKPTNAPVRVAEQSGPRPATNVSTSLEKPTPVMSAASNPPVHSQPLVAVPTGKGSATNPVPEEHAPAPPLTDWSAGRTPEAAVATQSVILPAKTSKRTLVPASRVSSPEVEEAVGGPAATQDASGSEVTGGGESSPVEGAKPPRPIPEGRKPLLMAALGVLGLGAALCFGLWIRSSRR